jgi:hypothetical protein
MFEVYINNPPGKILHNERTIDSIGSLTDQYAAAWHIQWLKGTISGKHTKSIPAYTKALKLQYEDKDAKDEAYTSLETVQYDWCIQNMFTVKGSLLAVIVVP